MKGHLTAFLSGIAVAAAAVFAYDAVQGRRVHERRTEPRRARRRRARSAAEQRRQPRSALIDINTAGREELALLGIEDPDMLDRIVENRPYRNKLDLVSRMIVTQDVYDLIKERISVSGADDAVKVAS